MAGISLDAKEVCQIFFGPNDSDEKTLHKEDTAIIKKQLFCNFVLNVSPNSVIFMVYLSPGAYLKTLLWRCRNLNLTPI